MNIKLNDMKTGPTFYQLEQAVQILIVYKTKGDGTPNKRSPFSEIFMSCI